MATRFCGICGTEVDEDAIFCPSCGNPIDAVDEPPGEIPAAPAWPEPERAEPAPVPEVQSEREPGRPPQPGPSPEPRPEPGAGSDADRGFEAAAVEPRGERRPPERQEEPYRVPLGGARSDRPAAPPPGIEPEATRPQAAPPPPPPATVPTTEEGRRPAMEQVDLPFTLPVMLSGWLIGIGSLVAALSLLLDFRTFANPVTLIVFLLLLAVAATVFLSSNIPDFENRRLWVLVVVVAAFGIGLWRVGLGASFAGVVFFLASLAAAAGAVLVELGRDRPMGGPVA